MRIELLCSNIQNKRQKGPNQTDTTPNDETNSIALHSHAIPIVVGELVPFSVVKHSGQVAEKEGSDWDVGHENVVVHGEVSGPEKLGRGRNGYGGDSAGADSDDRRAGVESVVGRNQENEERSGHRSR